MLLSGYDANAVQDAVSNRFSAPALQGLGVKGDAVTGRYTLGFAMTAQDVVAT